MNKSTLRKQESLRRNALSGEEVILLSKRLLKQFSILDFKGINTVHVFLPILEKNEPDTFMLISWLETNHPEIKIVVPRADFETSLMTHHPYAGAEALAKNHFNIWEPTDKQEHQGDIDMVIIPLLAFDTYGYRVGYGKGFYDRFLEGRKTLKVGLSFFESVDTISDTHANDIRLDVCITPEKIIYF